MYGENIIARSEIDGYDVQLVISATQKISKLEFDNTIVGYVQDVDLAQVIRAILNSTTVRKEFFDSIDGIWGDDRLKGNIEMFLDFGME